MHLIRRSVFRAASSPSLSFAAKPRAISTASPFLLRSKVQAAGVSPSVFRRFASDDASPRPADGEQAAVDSATESASESTNASEGASEGLGGEAAAAVYGGHSSQPQGDSEGRPRERREDRGFGGRDAARIDRRPVNIAPTSTLYVGNLLFDVTVDDLRNEFSGFGKIVNATLAADSRGLSKGFGYVEFEDIPTASAAIEAKHLTIYEGRRIIVNYMSKTKKERTLNEPSKTLFIGNLAFEMSDSDLNKLFRDIRNVVDVRVAIDRRTGQPRGFAHADFVDIESAVKGMEALQGKEVYGRELRLDYSGSQTARAAQFAGSKY